MDHDPNLFLLALDWGLKKVGFATSDPQGLVVTPRGSFRRDKWAKNKTSEWRLFKEDTIQIQKLIEDYEIGTIVLGQPFHLDGRESSSSESARDLAIDIAEQTDREVFLVNEALSSWAQSGTPHGGKNDDAGAAATILTDYLRGSAREKVSRKGGFASRTFLLAIATLIVMLISIASWSMYRFQSVPASKSSREIVVDVQMGSTLKKVRTQLEAQQVTIPALWFKVWSRFIDKNATLKPGEYKIQTGWSPARILQALTNGQPIEHKLTIKEGFNLFDIEALLEDYPVSAKLEVKKLLRDPNFFRKTLQDLSVPFPPGAPNLEGYVFPETYQYAKYESAPHIVKDMLSVFLKRAVPILSKHPWAKTPDGFYKLLIMASMVEKESGDFREQPIIASVFWNRLQKHMRFQSDPTTIYGLLPNFDGNIRRADLVRSTPYNTYTVSDFPVGPISNPGESALRAVVDPAKTEFLYFVSHGDGTHAFSKDYKTHEKFVQELIKKSRAKAQPQ